MMQEQISFPFPFRSTVRLKKKILAKDVLMYNLQQAFLRDGNFDKTAETGPASLH